MLKFVMKDLVDYKCSYNSQLFFMVDYLCEFGKFIGMIMAVYGVEQVNLF